MIETEYQVQFVTSTVLDWKHLFKLDKYKQVILGSLKFLVKEKRIKVYAFVIMSNHYHLIWQIQAGYKKEDVQRDFHKYTSQEIISDLKRNHPKVLPLFRVDKSDRSYQIWQRNPLTIELTATEFLYQKIEYIHCNPVKAGLCNLPEEYRYSSARFYESGIDEFGFLTHFED